MLQLKATALPPTPELKQMLAKLRQASDGQPTMPKKQDDLPSGVGKAIASIGIVKEEVGFVKEQTNRTRTQVLGCLVFHPKMDSHFFQQCVVTPRGNPRYSTYCMLVVPTDHTLLVNRQNDRHADRSVDQPWISSSSHPHLHTKVIIIVSRALCQKEREEV